MRMWLVDTRIMCRNHLLGEHLELHMFLGSLKKGKKIDGFLKNNLFEPRSLYGRHIALEYEMIVRKYSHNSPITEYDCRIIENLPLEKKYWEINREQALKDLLERCPQCKKRYEKLYEL